VVLSQVNSHPSLVVPSQSRYPGLQLTKLQVESLHWEEALPREQGLLQTPQLALELVRLVSQVLSASQSAS